MRRGGVVVLQNGEGSLHGGGLLLGRMTRVPEISECTEREVPYGA
jgi:hypothetical protein